MRKVALILLLTSFLISCNNLNNSKEAQNVDYKVGIIGAPSFPNVEWNDKNMELMKKLGFNALQLNIAWGYRPNDNPLNLEDVLVLPEQFKLPVDIDSTLNTNVGSSKTFIRSPDKIAARAQELKRRIALCKKHGFRSIFHFAARNVHLFVHSFHEKERIGNNVAHQASDRCASAKQASHQVGAH